MTDDSHSELDRLKGGYAHAPAELQVILTGPEVSTTDTSAGQLASAERVRFDRRKRRPAAIITRPGFYVPNLIESGDPLLNESRLRGASPPERVLVGHGRPKVPKLYFENSAPLLGWKDSLLPEGEALDFRMESPRSAPPANPESWGNIPNVLLTPRSLRLTSSDLAERLARRYSTTPRSDSFNQPSPRFEGLPDTPALETNGGYCAATADGFSLHPNDSAADDKSGNIASPARPPFSARASNPTAMPSNSIAASIAMDVEPTEKLKEGPLLKPVENSYTLRGSYNTCRAGVYDIAIGGAVTAISNDLKDQNRRRNGHTVAIPSEAAGPRQTNTPDATLISEGPSTDPPGLSPVLSSSAVESTSASCLPIQLVNNGLVPTHDARDDTRIRVYGSMMDSADLGVGTINRGLNVGVASLRPPSYAQQTQQQLPQRPPSVCQPSIGQAQQHHPHGSSSAPPRGLYQPSTNQPQAIDSLSSALIIAYELMRTNSLSSLSPIHYNHFGTPVNQVDSFRQNIPLGSSPLTLPTIGRFNSPNDMTPPVHLPQIPHHRSHVREGYYGRGRRPGATNLTVGVSPTTNVPGAITPTRSANTSDSVDDDSMTWQEASCPRPFNVLNLPASSVLGAASLLRGLNPPSYTLVPGYCCFIIKSKSEADVRASITHGIWSSTEKGNQRLNEQYNSLERSGPFLLIFCVNGSREVCGMAEMISPVDFENTPDIWEEKGVYKGSFKVRWVFCKNADYALFSHILLDATRGDLPALHLRDALPFNPKTGRSVVKALAQAPVIETILTHPKPARPPRRPRGQHPASSGTTVPGTRPEAPSSRRSQQ
ncbi:MAG: hypothetical protein M1840_003310 [Geoglossum simile]|nr:MAG: hypothetical protein M1840_003310 [Geoglossum simile]